MYPGLLILCLIFWVLQEFAVMQLSHQVMQVLAVVALVVALLGTWRGSWWRGGTL